MALIRLAGRLRCLPGLQIACFVRSNQWSLRSELMKWKREQKKKFAQFEDVYGEDAQAHWATKAPPAPPARPPALPGSKAAASSSGPPALPSKKAPGGPPALPKKLPGGPPALPGR